MSINWICRISLKDEEMSLFFVAILVLNFILKLRFPTSKSVHFCNEDIYQDIKES